MASLGAMKVEKTYEAVGDGGAEPEAEEGG